MTPRSSCLGGESTPLQGANLRLNYEINNVTENALGISRFHHPKQVLQGLSYRPPGSFLESTGGSVLPRAEGQVRPERHHGGRRCDFLRLYRIRRVSTAAQ